MVNGVRWSARGWSRSLLGPILFLCFCPVAYATPPLETETARLLKQGQLETDVAVEYQTSNEGSEFAVPLEFEYGITDWLSLVVEPVAVSAMRPKSALMRPASAIWK